MNLAAARYAGIGLAVLAVALAVVVLVPRLLGWAAGPEAEVLTRLRQTERTGLSLEVPGAAAPLVSARHAWQRFSVAFDDEAKVVFVAATLDFEGRLGEVKVSSLGVEKVAFRFEDGDPVPVEGWAPELVRVVRALEARRQALQRLDLAALQELTTPGSAPVADHPDLRLMQALADRRYDSRAWFIRLDRDAAQVTEEYRLQGVLPDRPVDVKGPRRLDLTRSGGEFYFSARIM